MNNAHVLVRNAADPKQVKNAARKQLDRRERELLDLRELLATETGRRVMWRLIEHCSPLSNPTHQRGDMTHQNIGRQDVGRFLYAEIIEADEDKILVMMKEARARDKFERVEAQAVREQSKSTDGDNEND